jgi:hypothetical protein
MAKAGIACFNAYPQSIRASTDEELPFFFGCKQYLFASAAIYNQTIRNKGVVRDEI